MSELWDAPNQQAVGLDPPWVEGSGGGDEPAPQTAADPLDEMTKGDLIDEAARRGVDVDPTATKAEIREALEA